MDAGLFEGRRSRPRRLGFIPGSNLVSGCERERARVTVAIACAVHGGREGNIDPARQSLALPRGIRDEAADARAAVEQNSSPPRAQTSQQGSITNPQLDLEEINALAQLHCLMHAAIAPVHEVVSQYAAGYAGRSKIPRDESHRVRAVDPHGGAQSSRQRVIPRFTTACKGVHYCVLR